MVIDHQNVHLTGHELFASTRDRPQHESLVDPLLFANRWILVRNAAQRPGADHAVLRKVLVFRGLPSSEHDPDSYARNLAQQRQWERDRGVRVTLRPLKYTYQWDGAGNRVRDADGKYIVKGKREKGIDVLCALAVVREAQASDTDLVMLASADSDLEPALDEALELGTAKIETFTWFDPEQPKRCRQLRPRGERSLWNTRMIEADFNRCWDPTKYD